MDNAATTTATTHFRSTKLHRENTAALEADVTDGNLFAGKLLLRGSLDNRRTGLAAKQQAGGIGFRVTTDEQNALSHLGHHMAEVGQRERFADPAFTIDRDDLRFRCGFALWHFERMLFIGLVAQTLIKVFQVWNLIFHAVPQFKIIFRQAGSVNAVS